MDTLKNEMVDMPVKKQIAFLGTSFALAALNMKFETALAAEDDIQIVEGNIPIFPITRRPIDIADLPYIPTALPDYGLPNRVIIKGPGHSQRKRRKLARQNPHSKYCR